MKSLFGETRRPHRPRLEILPMIDVMLLMLVFYILSTTSLTHQHGIPVDLPKATTGAADSGAGAEVTITIDKDGELYVNKAHVHQQSLAPFVKDLAEHSPGGIKALDDKGVVINADLNVQHRLVVFCMDAMRSIDVTHFNVATNPAGTTP